MCIHQTTCHIELEGPTHIAPAHLRHGRATTRTNLGEQQGVEVVVHHRHLLFLCVRPFRSSGGLGGAVPRLLFALELLLQLLLPLLLLARGQASDHTDGLMHLKAYKGVWGEGGERGGGQVITLMGACISRPTRRFFEGGASKGEGKGHRALCLPVQGSSALELAGLGIWAWAKGKRMHSVSTTDTNLWSQNWGGA